MCLFSPTEHFTTNPKMSNFRKKKKLLLCTLSADPFKLIPHAIRLPSAQFHNVAKRESARLT